MRRQLCQLSEPAVRTFSCFDIKHHPEMLGDAERTFALPQIPFNYSPNSGGKTALSFSFSFSSVATEGEVLHELFSDIQAFSVLLKALSLLFLIVLQRDEL